MVPAAFNFFSFEMMFIIFPPVVFFSLAFVPVAFFFFFVPVVMFFAEMIKMLFKKFKVFLKGIKVCFKKMMFIIFFVPIVILFAKMIKFLFKTTMRYPSIKEIQLFPNGSCDYDFWRRRCECEQICNCCHCETCPFIRFHLNRFIGKSDFIRFHGERLRRLRENLLSCDNRRFNCRSCGQRDFLL